MVMEYFWETPERVQEDIGVLKSGSYEERELYLRTKQLTRDGLTLLIASKDVRLILLAAQKGNFDSFNELLMVRLKIEALILGYLDLYHVLWVDAEEALISSKLVSATRKLYEKFPLSERGEVALLKSDNKELIKEYEAKWGFRSREAKNRRINM